MRPRRAILTNLHTDLDYETLRASLPANVTPAYDGMRVEGFEASPAEETLDDARSRARSTTSCASTPRLRRASSPRS